MRTANPLHVSMLQELETLEYPHCRLRTVGGRLRADSPGFDHHFKTLVKTLGNRERAFARLRKLGRGTPERYEAFMAEHHPKVHANNQRIERKLRAQSCGYRQP